METPYSLNSLLPGGGGDSDGLGRYLFSWPWLGFWPVPPE